MELYIDKTLLSPTIGVFQVVKVRIHSKSESNLMGYNWHFQWNGKKTSEYITPGSLAVSVLCLCISACIHHTNITYLMCILAPDVKLFPTTSHGKQILEKWESGVWVARVLRVLSRNLTSDDIAEIGRRQISCWTLCAIASHCPLESFKTEK